MSSTLVKHVIYESALDVLFNTIHNNIITWKASTLQLTNFTRTDLIGPDGPYIEYSTYYNGEIHKSNITLELINDLSAMTSVDDDYIDALMRESLQHEIIFKQENPNLF